MVDFTFFVLLHGGPWAECYDNVNSRRSNQTISTLLTLLMLQKSIAAVLFSLIPVSRWSKRTYIMHCKQSF